MNNDRRILGVFLPFLCKVLTQESLKIAVLPLKWAISREIYVNWQFRFFLTSELQVNHF